MMSVPSMWCIIGSTGTGKTNLLMNIIAEIGSFSRFYLIVKNPDEPMYTWFIDALRKIERKTRRTILYVHPSLENLPDLKEIEKEETNLLIFDDQIAEPTVLLNKVGDYYIAGRKRCASCVFIAQRYFSIPIMIRQNTTYFFLLDVKNAKDLRRILGEFRTDRPVEEVMALYYSVMDPEGGKQKRDREGHSKYNKIEHCFMIDTLASTSYKDRFRDNFTGIGDRVADISIVDERLGRTPGSTLDNDDQDSEESDSAYKRRKRRRDNLYAKLRKPRPKKEKEWRAPMIGPRPS